MGLLGLGDDIVERITFYFKQSAKVNIVQTRAKSKYTYICIYIIHIIYVYTHIHLHMYIYFCRRARDRFGQRPNTPGSPEVCPYIIESLGPGVIMKLFPKIRGWV